MRRAASCGHTGTPSALLPRELGETQYEKGADGFMVSGGQGGGIRPVPSPGYSACRPPLSLLLCRQLTVQQDVEDAMLHANIIQMRRS